MAGCDDESMVGTGIRHHWKALLGGGGVRDPGQVGRAHIHRRRQGSLAVEDSACTPRSS